MPQAARFDLHPPLRVLVVELGDRYPPLDVDRLTACLKRMRLVGIASDCDDALRLILMTYPDVIVLPWSVSAAKLLRALDYLRNPRFSPRVLVVTDPCAPVEGFTPPEGVVAVDVDFHNPEGLVDSLCAVLAEPIEPIEPIEE